ncbi:MAG: DUF4339 domain-containing protein [Rhizobacter sp.]|nr:DUF4339 domain-containing protein [Bacteriovorax sp.]
MNKEWFIFKGTHHLGPFSLQEMEEFFTVGEINSQSLVWREGAEKWEALGKTRELDFLIKNPNKKPELPDTNAKPAAPVEPVKKPAPVPDLPPELPDLPADDHDDPPILPKFLQPDGPAAHKTKVSIPKPKIEIDFDEPPPIPLDAILNPGGRRPEFKKKTESHFNSKTIFGICIIIFGAVLAWFFVNERSSSAQIRVKGVMPVYQEKLQEIASQKTPSIVVGIALSLDGRTLFASTNKDGEILSIIKLKSLPKRVLGTTEAELMVRGLIKNHLGEFSRMQLTKGPQFVPGEYDVEFTGRKLFFLNREFKFLNNIAFFKKLNTTYNFHSSTLIYAGTPREFEKKLIDYKEAITNEKLKPFNDKLERLQTFSSLLNKTVEEYLLELEKIKKPKEISVFEKKYIKDISGIVQSLTVEASESSKMPEAQKFDMRYKVATYTSQVQLGKQIGEMASDMITETAKLKKITDSNKAKLKTRFEARYKNIKSQIDAHIIKLHAEIQKISN